MDVAAYKSDLRNGRFFDGHGRLLPYVARSTSSWATHEHADRAGRSIVTRSMLLGAAIVLVSFVRVEELVMKDHAVAAPRGGRSKELGARATQEASSPYTTTANVDVNHVCGDLPRSTGLE